MATVDSTTASPSGARAPSPTRPTSVSANARNLSLLNTPQSVGDAPVQMTPLYVREGDAFYEAPARQILLQAQQLIDRQFHRQCLVLSNPQLVRVFLKIHLGRHDHEVFAALFLDSHHRLIEYVELFRGTIDAAQVHPREVVKEALARNAAAVILAHNHPSGVGRPSKADQRMTMQLKEALDLVGVKVLDHIIVGESIASFVELGLL
jgi:DNA repair protein RadC